MRIFQLSTGLTLAVVILMILAGLAAADSINLPQTGQTTCFDVDGVEIPCIGSGQDGNVRAGMAWPEPRYTDNGDGTMTDNLTGLIWMQDCGVTGFMSWQDAQKPLTSPPKGLRPSGLPFFSRLLALPPLDHAR